MADHLLKIEESFSAALHDAKDVHSLNELRVEYFGKKGKLTQLLQSIGQLKPEDRPQFGQKVNEVRARLEGTLSEKMKEFELREEQSKIESELIDVTLPGSYRGTGSLHPLTQIERKIVSIFSHLGFSVETGPEIETDFYNFEALNFPLDHPARDMQDTFFLTDGRVLRTHTTPVQIRTMERKAPPIQIVMPGRVFRHDSDVTHSPVFHQVDGVCVGERVNFSHLKGTIEAFIHMMFGAQLKARFRPSFFPFTEPSAEVDMQCGTCKGKGCRVCKNTGWIEILGCGMVDPNVFENAGKAWTVRGEKNPYDPDRISGFAWGMGVERVAMVLHGIDDIRLFYENDQRFLDQFKAYV